MQINSWYNYNKSIKYGGIVMKKRICIISIIIVFIVSICFMLLPRTQSENASQITNYPKAFMIQNPNYFDYQPDLECSAFASAYLLRHYGQDAEGLKLFVNFPGKLSDGRGVKPEGVTEFFKRQGYHAEFVVNGTIDGLKSEIAKGAPVIVFIHVAEPYENPHYTHYVPIVGYDEKYFYFAESLDYLANCKEQLELSYNRKTTIIEFKKLWNHIDNIWDYPYFIITPQK